MSSSDSSAVDPLKSQTNGSVSKKVFKCIICSKSFPRHRDLCRHPCSRSVPKPHHCPECPESFQLSSQLSAHQRAKHPEDKVTSSSETKTEARVTSSSESKPETRVTSSTETKKVAMKPSLKLIVHPEVEDMSEDRNKTGTKVGTRSRLNKQTDSATNTESRADSTLMEKTNSEKKRALDSQSNVQTESPGNRRKRMLQVIGELNETSRVEKRQDVKSPPKKWGEASSSGKGSKSEGKLKPYVCKVCGKTCAYLAHLTRHALVHSTDMPFKCGKCEAKFKREDGLQRHYFNVHNISKRKVKET